MNAIRVCENSRSLAIFGWL